jgi:hypothetical protein
VVRSLPRIPVLLLLLVAAAAGLAAFAASAYRISTLAIDARVGQAGEGTVFWDEGGGFSEKNRRTFAIEDGSGGWDLYAVGLPAVPLRNLRIAPLAPGGQFEIGRVNLSNGVVRYDWTPGGGCTRQQLRSPVFRREPCAGGGTQLSAAADGSLVISHIDPREFERTRGGRILLAAVASLAAILGGAWLLLPFRRAAPGEAMRASAVRLAWLAVAGLFLYQFALVLRYSVDVPIRDEWEYFGPHALSRTLSWPWVFAFHGEHRIVLTKLLTWLNYRLFGLDLTLQVFVNFGIFGSLLVLLARLRDRATEPGEPFRLFPLFLLFLLSPIAWENHLWAFQSQIHLCLLFFALALVLLHRRAFTTASALGAWLSMLIAAYAFSAGIVFALVALLSGTAAFILRMSDGSLPRTAGRRALLAGWALIGAGTALWFKGYGAAGTGTGLVLPWTAGFWEYFLNLSALGFGFTKPGMLPGILALAWSFLPAVLLLRDRDLRRQPSTWLAVTALASVLAALAAITMGRAGQGAWYGPKSSRYAEIAFLLVPFSTLGWWLAVRRRNARFALVTALWAFCLWGFGSSWTVEPYRASEHVNRTTLERLDRYYRGDLGDGDRIYKEGAEPLIDRARELGVHFTKQFAPAATDGRGMGR